MNEFEEKWKEIRNSTEEELNQWRQNEFFIKNDEKRDPLFEVLMLGILIGMGTGLNKEETNTLGKSLIADLERGKKTE